MEMLSVRIDLSGKSVMVIGSTPQALLLLKSLCGCTRSLFLLSSSPSDEIRAFCKDKQIPISESAYNREALFGMDYVFCASASEDVVNDTAAICRTMGIRLFSYGHPDKSDFFPCIPL